ncbi:MAG: tetratricopeptide repeat-containing sensor histidine kinase [Bacteroidota bacterium]
MFSKQAIFRIIPFVISLHVAFCGVSRPVTSDPELDSLMGIIESGESSDSLLYETYSRLAWELKSVNPQQALEFALESLSLAEKMNQDDKVADALSNIGVIYWQMGSFTQALDHHLEALSLYTLVNDPVGIARSNTNIGLIFSDQSYYEKALEYYFRALLLYEQNEHKAGMAVVMNNIGMVYESQKDYDLAERYHLQSLQIKQEANDIKGMSFSYNNLGLVYQGKKQMDKARDYFYKALEIRDSLNDKREIATTASNLGYLHYLQSDYPNAMRFLNRARDLYEAVDDKSGMSKTLNYIGLIHKNRGQLTEARSFFERSMEIAKEIGLNRMIAENYNHLAGLMATLGNYRTAYQYQQQFIALKDSLYSEDSRRKIIELQLMYDREQKESEIQLIRKNEQINMLSSQRDRLLRNFLIAGVMLILISLFLLYNRFLIAKNANQLLEKQKDEISQTNKKLVSLNHNLLEQKKKFEELNHQLNLSNQKLVESEKHLIEVNATKDKFFSIISHDLRNPFAAIVSFSRILKRDMANLSQEDMKELALELDKSVLKINNLLENLLQWSRTQTGKIKYEPEYIAIHEIVKDNILLFRNNANEKQITLIDSVDDDTPVWADKNMTDTVIRNLLSNALKYTEQGGKIEIKSDIHDHMVFISVIDNGVGMTEESKSKIFRVDTLHSTYGTMDEKGSGLGLLLCKEFVEKQGGNISFESELNKGSVFTFSLPIENNIGNTD